MKKYILFICLIICLTFGCAPKKFETFIPEKLEYPKTATYSSPEIVTQNIPPLEKKYVKEQGNSYSEVDSLSQSTHIIIKRSEYKKILVILKLLKSQKNITKEQEQLINEYIKQINLLKDQIVIERDTLIRCKKLWVEAENLRREQGYDFKIENFWRDVNSILGGLSLISLIIILL